METDATDQAGNVTHARSDGLRQRYRLSFDRYLTEYVAASAGGTFADDQATTHLNGNTSDQHDRTTSAFGRLSLATPVLTVGLGVDRRQQETLTPALPSLVTESFSGDASYHPLDLPELQLRASHVDTYDRPLRDQDSTTDSAQLGLRYRQPRYELRYLLSWTRNDDNRHGVESTSVDQSAVATRTDALLDGRITSYLSGTVQNRSTLVSAAGPGGTVTRQQLPFAGFSTIVTPPTLPANAVLVPTPALVDGNTTQGSSVNVGFGAALPLGDGNAREVGGQFADRVTDVNTLYVWFDHPLSPAVKSALIANAFVYESDNNVTWAPVLGAVGAPGQVDSRIEITIPVRRARYLKVSLAPIAAGVTVDAAFRDLFVSEVQFLLVLPVELVPRRAGSLYLSATGIVKTTVLRSPELNYDLSATVTRQSGPELTTYTVVNGLSLLRKLTPGLVLNARGARQDQNDGQAHVGAWQWNAGLAGNPLPRAYWSLTYSGSATDTKDYTNALTALGRADWYEGISTQTSGSTSILTQGLRVARAGQATTTTTLSPNAYVTLSLGALYSRSLVSDPDRGDILTQYARVDGTLSLTPAPALSAAGNVSRVLLGDRRTTLATMQGSYSPLRGELQLSIAYSKALDTEARTTTQFFSPSLRWNIRSGASLTVAYTNLRNDAPDQTLSTRALTASLLIAL